MSALGPKLPLFRDETNGSFSLIFSLAEEVKQNFKNLLLTAPGERMMNPDFGVGVRNFLFLPRQQITTELRQRIEGQVARYMPFLQIKKIQFNRGISDATADDLNVLSISIEYAAPSVDLASEIVIRAEEI
jgi:phage baseplate assembly protein W|tara:strand:+ start:227 stop:619 length:393 start_codon:yes stop_codon:yes gene_type:complete